MVEQWGRITTRVWRNFAREWKANPGHCRFGQAFLNKFYPNISDPTLFYATDPALCERLIVKEYVL